MKTMSSGSRQFLTFCIVGVTSIAIDWTLTYLFVYHTSWPGALANTIHTEYFPTLDVKDLANWIAKFVAVAVATLNGFYWNSRYTFASSGVNRSSKKFLQFALVIAIGLVMNATLMALALSPFPRPPTSWQFWMAQVVSTGAVTLWNFFANKYWTFRPDGNRSEVY